MKFRPSSLMDSRYGALTVLALLLACASCLAAQWQSPGDLAVGKVLVAARDLPDPVFAKSVVLLVHYDKTGTLGLMLNHRTHVPISSALSSIKDAAGHSDPIFLGGPVEMGTVLALMRAPAKPDGADAVLGHTYFISTKTGLVKALQGASKPSDLRIYLGYCGWAPQQLETEVSEGRWYIFDGSDAVAFDAKPDTLWTRLIAKTEGRLALFIPALPGR